MRYILIKNDTFNGVCFNHNKPISINGRIVSCNNGFVKINGVSISTQGDICLSFCGHKSKTINTTTFVKINGIPICLVGDFISGNGIFGRFYTSYNNFVKSI